LPFSHHNRFQSLPYIPIKVCSFCDMKEKISRSLANRRGKGCNAFRRKDLDNCNEH
jgi:hypothetical protein